MSNQKINSVRPQLEANAAEDVETNMRLELTASEFKAFDKALELPLASSIELGAHLRVFEQPASEVRRPGGNRLMRHGHPR
jgi:hypothetical protein